MPRRDWRETRPASRDEGRGFRRPQGRRHDNRSPPPSSRFSLNRVFLVGYLGEDPRRLKTKSISACSFTLATNTYFGDEETGKKSLTVWHYVAYFSQNAENCLTYLRSGSMVSVWGTIRYSEFKDYEGQTRRMAQVLAYDVQFLAKPPAHKPTEDDREF